MSGQFGYTPYKPSDDTRYWLECTREILSEYQAELPLTVRQIFYRLVASYGYDKTEKAYSRLASILTRARRATVLRTGDCPKIPFTAIRDDKLRSQQGYFYEDAEDFARGVREAADSYRLDRQEGQPRRLEMWCEAQGMMPVLTGIAQPYSIRTSSSGGYDSITTKHNLAVRVANLWNDEGQPTLVLHVGDFDGSGEDMYLNLEEDVGTMVRQRTGTWDAFKVQRVALTEEQVIERNAITAPPKPTDSRTRAFVARHPDAVEWAGSDEITVQLEALTPTELRELFEDVIQGHLDQDAYDTLMARETDERDRLAAKLAEADLTLD